MYKERSLLNNKRLEQNTNNHLINSVTHLNYWERLKSLDLYSLEHRRERYIVIYTWKIAELVPSLNTQIYPHKSKNTPNEKPGSTKHTKIKRSKCEGAKTFQRPSYIGKITSTDP